MTFPKPTIRRIAIALAALVTGALTAMAAPISVTSYAYGTNAESQPQPTSFQSGLISDVGNLKLGDNLLSTGAWNDGRNVGFRNDTDNGNPQPRITFDLGSPHSVATIAIWSNADFLTNNESVNVASSVDGVTFSTPITVAGPIFQTGGFTNSKLRRELVTASSLPGGRYFRLEFFDPSQWMMINEVQFDGVPSGPDLTPPSLLPSNIVDDKSGGLINTNTLITYTLTFSEDIDHTSVNAADFGNAGNAPVSFGAITETSPGVFSIAVTPTATGTLQLKINAGAGILDMAGLAMNTAAAIIDNTTIDVVVAPPDTTKPTPNPMTFAAVPYASSESSIAMVAATASDAAGVEYYFDETSGNPGSDDSGWQSSPTYQDAGLATGQTYTYTVTARDLSSNNNATAPSAPASALAQTPITPPPSSPLPPAATSCNALPPMSAASRSRALTAWASRRGSRPARSS